MILVIIIAAIILLLVASAYKEYKDRISVEELPKVIKELIKQGKEISVLNKEMIYTPEEEEFLTNGLEMAWAYEGDKSYRRLAIKYRELEKVINKKRFEKTLDGLRIKNAIKREFEKSLVDKINTLKEDYPEVYYKCFKDESEVNEYIERLMESV